MRERQVLSHTRENDTRKVDAIKIRIVDQIYQIEYLVICNRNTTLSDIDFYKI